MNVECHFPTEVELLKLNKWRKIGLGLKKSLFCCGGIFRNLISEVSEHIGSQSISVVIDVRKTGLFRKYEVVTHNGKQRTGLDPVKFAERMQDLGAGEIILNSVDLDGKMQGYDLDLVARLKERVRVPMTILGGVGSLEHVTMLWKRHGLIGAAAGSLFVFKGKYNAVLINYPNINEKAALLERAGWLS